MPKDSVHSSSNASKDESVREKEERLREKLKQKAERRKQSDSPRPSNRQPRTEKQGNGGIGNQDVSSRQSNRGSIRDESHRRNRAKPKMAPFRGPRGYRGREMQGDRRIDRSVPDMNRSYYYPPHEHYGGGYETHQYSYRNGPSDRRSRVEPPRWEREEYFEGNRDRSRQDYDRYDKNFRGRMDYHDDRERFERVRRRTSSRSYSRSRSRSDSNSSYSSRSRSSSRSYRSSSSRSRSYSSDVSSRKMSKSPSRSRSHSGSRSYSKRNDTRSPSSSVEPSRNPQQIKEDEFTKEQRTVLVSQLVMKADERDIRHYFRKQLGSKVNDVILLRDKRTGRHKGCAYVELANLGDVDRVMEASGKIPDFQRFPIMIKASDTDKHSQVVETDTRIEAQKVYIGNIDQNVTQSQLYAIFSQFGDLERVLLQVDISTGLSKGYAFLSYHDPKVSNLAIVAMSGQMFGNKPIKTGWANQNSAAPGIKEVQSNEFPEDAVARVERANIAFKQLNGIGLTQTPGILLVPGMASRVLAYQALSPDASKNQIIAIAEEAVNLALGLLPSATPSNTPLPISLPPIDDDNPKFVKGELSKHILVRNMFDKDEETEENWAQEIKAEFEEECSKYGTIQNVIVVSNEVGGKIFATFDSIEGAASCAENLAGRWFDKRQLRVEFVSETPSR